MTDYLGPLALGTSGTYVMTRCDISEGSAAIEVIVHASTADALAVVIEALVANLQQGACYAHYQPGVTNPAVYRVTSVSAFKQDALDTWLAFWQRVSFTLALSAMPAGALVTLYSAHHLDSPASLSLDALLGTNATMPDVTLKDDNNTDIHSVWMALCAGLPDSLWLRLVDSLTWSAPLTAGTGATWWGNACGTTTSATYSVAPLDTSQYPAGKYRLLARASQSAGTGYVMDAQNNAPVAVTRTTPHLIVIGDLDLPSADTAPGVAANLALSVKSDGTNTLTVGAFILLPLDLGYVSWHHPSPTTEIDQLDVGPSGVYVDHVTDWTYLQGGLLTARILAAHVGTLIAPPDPTGSAWPLTWARTDDSSVTATGGQFQVVVASTEKYAWYAATTAECPLVLPGAWYEVLLTRFVSARSAGVVTASVVWLDIDGNIVQTDLLSSAFAVDSAPVALTLYAKAPVHAARAQVKLGADGHSTTTWESVVLRRAPLRLVIIAEDAEGALTNYAHPTHISLRYSPRWEIARGS